MEDLEVIERVVRAGAKRGALSVSKDRQVVADAIEQAQAQWVEAVLGERKVADWSAWAFRVAANAAKKIGKLRAGGRLGRLDENARMTQVLGRALVDEAERERMRAYVLRNESRLVGRQRDVLLRMCEPGMSLHRAAKELGMDRSSLRRSFKSGLERLKRR